MFITVNDSFLNQLAVSIKQINGMRNFYYFLGGPAFNTQRFFDLEDLNKIKRNIFESDDIITQASNFPLFKYHYESTKERLESNIKKLTLADSTSD